MLQGEHSAIPSTFIKLPIVIKIFVLPIFEWPFYTGFTVVLTYFVLSMEKSMQIVCPSWSNLSLRVVSITLECNRVKMGQN